MWYNPCQAAWRPALLESLMMKRTKALHMNHINRKAALTVIAVVLTLAASWHTLESFSIFLRNGSGLAVGNPGPAAMSSNIHNLVSLLLSVCSSWALAALAWLVRGEAVVWLSGQTAQQPVTQPLNVWPPPPVP